MDLLSFGVGSLITAFAMALFSKQDDKEKILEDEYDDQQELKINQGTKRRTLSCQTCRKLKTHIEIEPYLFECMKCKRRTDLR